MSSTSPAPDRHRRLAAVASLTAGAGALLAALAFTVSSLQSVVAGVLGLTMAIAGGWHAACNRGRDRVIGVLMAALGLVLAVGGLLEAETGMLGLALAIALAAGSVASARRATGRRPDAVVAADLDPPAPAARRGVLIMNLKSGGGKAEHHDLVDACRERGIEPVILRPGDDLRAVAERAVAGGADVLGMAGGDGSLGIVAGVASQHGLPFVVVPAGTRNHFALDIGLDRADVVGALDAFGRGVGRTVDLARVNGRAFVNNASLGLYAEIVASDSYRDAKLRTVLEALPDLLGPDANRVELNITGPDGQPRSAGQIVLVSNNAYTFDSLDGLGTRARLDTGRLGVVSLTVNSAEDARRLLALQAARSMPRFAGWQAWEVPELQVGAGRPVPIAVDGESLTLDPPLRFELLPRALTLQLPANAPGRSPAARSLGRDVPLELWALARGRSGSAAAPMAPGVQQP